VIDVDCVFLMKSRENDGVEEFVIREEDIARGVEFTMV
jgi:hypothetical protein